MKGGQNKMKRTLKYIKENLADFDVCEGKNDEEDFGGCGSINNKDNRSCFNCGRTRGFSKLTKKAIDECIEIENGDFEVRVE